MWKNNYLLLKKENKLRMESVSQEHGEQIRDMINYLSTGQLERFELLIVHKDLIGMALEAQINGQTLQQVLGMEEKKFCDQILEQADSPNRVVKFLSVVRNLSEIFGLMFLLSAVLLYGDRYISVSGSNLILFLIFGICYIVIEVILTSRLVFYKKIKRFMKPVFFIMGCMFAWFYRGQINDASSVWYQFDAVLMIFILAVIWVITTLLFYNIVNKDANKYHWRG